MPWSPSQASGFTHRANTKRKREAWARVANEQLSQHGDEARAVRIANQVVHNIGKCAVLWEILRAIPQAAGVVDVKLTKEEANYHDLSIDLMKCKGCMYFEPSHSCQLVHGKINPEGWCEHYLSDSQSHTGFSFGVPS